MSVTITRDEWLSEFERVMRQPRKGDPGLTTTELAEAMGITTARCNAMLQQAHRQGRILCGRKPMFAIDGRSIMVPCYQLKPEPKAAKRR